MSKISEGVLLALFVAGIYCALPVSIVHGWVCWTKRRPRLTAYSFLSLVGFTLATASALLAVASLTYAQAIHGFTFYDPLLLRIYKWGGLLSLCGFVLSLAGVWRENPLRWHAPVCSAGMLLFWFAMAMGE